MKIFSTLWNSAFRTCETRSAKISSIAPWNHDGPFLTPYGITANWNRPVDVMTCISFCARGLARACVKPLQASMTDFHRAAAMARKASHRSTVRPGRATVMALSSRKSQIQRPLSSPRFQTTWHFVAISEMASGEGRAKCPSFTSFSTWYASRSFSFWLRLGTRAGFSKRASGLSSMSNSRPAR